MSSQSPSLARAIVRVVVVAIRFAFKKRRFVASAVFRADDADADPFAVVRVGVRP
jgi:uncharacterized membrane-anchored protein